MRGLWLLLLVGSIDFVFGARILAVLSSPSRSHHVISNAILRTLAGRGHEVVYYSALPSDRPVANLTFVQLESTKFHMPKEALDMMLDLSPIRATTLLWQQRDLVIGNLMKSERFTQLIESSDKFDLVILQTFLAEEPLLALGHKFKAPVINLQPFVPFSLINRAAGNPLNLAFIPDFSFPHSDRMSLYERGLNAYSVLSSLYSYYTHHIPIQDQNMRQLFKDPDLPPLLDLIQNVSLTFSNAHPFVHYSQPYAHNIVPIGGIHLAKKQKPLLPEMKKFLDEAPVGAIYFSVGSVVPDHLLDEEYFKNFLNVFKRLPQRVLWKTNSDLKDLPSNVMTAKWIPQEDVLAHPKLKVFMTHGGLFSQHEAIFAGVPVVCTPYFWDQPFNARFYEEKGIGVQLPYQTLSEKTIYSALTTVINDPKYKKNMVQLSSTYRDRSLGLEETVVFWVEYVLRHKGAPHLRPAAATMSWYQLALVDILGTILTVLFLTLALLYLLLKRIIKLLLGRNQYLMLTTSDNK